ncbi:chromosome partitioning protein [Sinomonas sp. JGH33]|uniref:Chromosome partitioning protein n=1 Tax=Sinomonas terricola TaxID=3110330 RepID=A0ABU5T0A7_9MICC|nr:chromosome partitioning protein [Sinomonas sp. JGH33]MEA5453103.1 chromosome partitioning protein [Sinomonas sp. JGH33]
MSIPVVTIGSEQAELVGGLERLHGPVTVVRRCAELAELVAACQSGLARVAVVVGDTADITVTLVDRLAAVAVGIVGLSDDDGERRRLDGLGVGAAHERVRAEDLAELIAEAARRAGALAAAGASASSFSLAGARPVADVPTTADEVGESGDGGAAATGEIIAFWGPTGAPGRTTLAINAAAELVRAGKSVLVVDADTYGASVAAQLGLLDEAAGLAQACRLGDQGALDAGALRRLATPVVTEAGILLVLTGITRADRWPELRAAALGTVLERSREIADVVVIDAGFCLEADEELSFDTMAPRRNAATLRSLELADRIVAVGAADAVGMPRLVRALAELEQAVPHASPDVVFNKVRKGALGRFPERALRDAWDRFGPRRPITALVPYDVEAADASLLGGSLLLECAPQSPLRTAVANVVCSPVQRNRKTAVASARALVTRPR